MSRSRIKNKQVVRLLNRTWEVQTLTDEGWRPVEHEDNPCPRFSIAVRIFLDQPAPTRRLLRDGKPLVARTPNPSLFDQEEGES